MRETLNTGIISFCLLLLCVPCFAFGDNELVTVFSGSFAPVATLSVPRHAIQPSEVAVLINDNDPQS